MKWVVAAALLVACGDHHPATPDAADAAPPDAFTLPAPILPGDFPRPLDRAFIRSLQTWIDDPTFDVKWTAMTASPIAMLGGADSAFHADLATRATPLPGGEVVCHGDAKLDNFGWVLADGHAVFSDVDFDDAGPCPAAADAIHFLVSTDLFFASSVDDELALNAYVDTVANASAAAVIDPATVPAWDTLRADGVDKATAHGKITLGGDLQAASTAEVAAIQALVAGDPRFPTTVLDIARDIRTDGGSAGLRRFWVLCEDAAHPRTIIELKELAPPGTSFGPHATLLDGADRFDRLKAYWWQTPAVDDHFGVMLLGARFVARDRFTRTTFQDPSALAAEASLLALRHRDAWHGVDPDQLRSWLRDSAAAVTARWRAVH